jgi:hypothetical protein
MPSARGSLGSVVPGRESQSAESLGNAENVESAENIEEPAGAEKGEAVEGAGLFEPTVEPEPPLEAAPPEAADQADPVEPAPTRDESERAQEARPEFERVTEVLGPLEQIVLAADQQIGSLQERVDAEADVSARVDKRVREAAVEQRARVVKMREELTDAATQLATRFETMLDMLDQAERQLSIQAGDVRVKVTERGRMTISHEQTTEAEAGTKPGGKPPPAIEAPGPEPDAPEQKGRGIRGWFRRFRGSDA